MLAVLPQAVALNPEAFAHAVAVASEWSCELLLGTWAIAEQDSVAMVPFYDQLFAPLGDNGDTVRSVMTSKQQRFGARLMPLLLHEAGVLEPLSGPQLDPFDMTEVRTLLTLIGSGNVFERSGPDASL